MHTADDPPTGARKLMLYMHTVRHLRLRQLVFRPVRRLQRQLPRVKAATVSLDRLNVDRLSEVVAEWEPLNRAAVLARADAICRGEFSFVGETMKLGTPAWNERHGSHLWSYNLHYFDFAMDLAWAARWTGDHRYLDRLEQLVTSWIIAARDSMSDGMDPYPTSLRTVNWMHAYLLTHDQFEDWFATTWMASAHEQLQMLDRRLEWHILGNHLQKNLHALAVGGLLFNTAEAESWRGERLRLLWRESFEQVLDDGMHYERSPMYHLLFLRDFLQLADLMDAVGRKVGGFVRNKLVAMTRAAGAVLRPDGTMHLLNDTAHTDTLGIAEIRELAGHVLGEKIAPPEGTWRLPAAGYFGFNDERQEDRIIVDCGEPGPSYQPGHGHCDLLSFELDLHGQPVIVDTGVKGYGGDDLRGYVRSTAAHNTVVIGGREQHEIWDVFRVARRARILGAEVSGDAETFRFRGAYRPYHATRGDHTRTIERLGPGAWRVEDSVSAGEGERLDSYLHFHPDARLLIENDRVIARFHGLQVVITTFGFDDVAIAQANYCPAFGNAVAAQVLHGIVNANDGRISGWELRAIAREPVR